MKYNNYFVFDGKPSTEFGLIISGSSTWGSSEFDIDSDKVPGRNGEILAAHGQFKNFSMEYPDCAIVRNLHAIFPELRAFLLSHTDKYYKLEDTYHPDEFLKAVFDGSLSPTYDAYNDAGTVDIKFNAMPQRWLKSGDRKYEIKSGSYIQNPTYFTARPLIRVYGTGRLTVGDISVDISSDYKGAYMDLDSDIYDAYRGSENTNKYIRTTDYEFPIFKGGEKTRIIFDSTITKVEITPRWWTI